MAIIYIYREKYDFKDCHNTFGYILHPTISGDLRQRTFISNFVLKFLNIPQRVTKPSFKDTYY